jgi:serpin B
MKRLTFLALALVLPLAAAGLLPANQPPTRAEKKAVADGNSRFALELYGKLRGKEGNLFFSPYSVSTALAMTSAGARGKTLDEMTAVLHLPEQKKLHPALGALIEEANSGGKRKGYQLSVANALWGQRGRAFEPAFLGLNRRHYGAGFQQVDFQRNPEGARQTINAWVEKQTQEKIKDLIKPGVLDNMTRLVLTNAVYFKGDWSRPFPKAGTQNGPFHVAPGSSVNVPMMTQDERLGYTEDAAVQVLGLPYKGNDLDMVLILPKAPNGLAAVESTLTPEKLQGWLSGLRGRKVQATVPRFKLINDFDLRTTLIEMGIRDAFGKDADFSGIDGTRELMLGAVLHKAFVEVNEQGTVAAAATAVEVRLKACLPNQTIFRADHPFLFLIRDFRSGSILFVGRVTDPR